MRIEVKDRLEKEYNKLKFKSLTTAIKYRYTYNEVNVNLYFDEYDEFNPSMSMILAYDKKYYYTSLNVKDTNLTKEYLERIPRCILEHILNADEKLDDFFNSIDEHILNGNYRVINYKKDTYFTNTVRFNRNRSNLPFLYTIRKVRMSDETLCKLYETMGIDRLTLEKIQDEKLTLVRTDDPEKRKSLTAILKGIAIEI